MSDEIPILFDCAGDRLLGILHRPRDGDPSVGVVLVVGGPQYRVGSHRQFVLLARHLAAAGIPVFRFDYRGMGDSTGAARDFEAIGEDTRAALEAFLAQMPGVGQVVLWGLCDAATANAFYALTDPRVAGQIAANPWARTEAGEAQAFIRHYYLRRLLSGAFWRKVLSLRFDAPGALRDFLRKLGKSRTGAAGQAGTARDNRPLPVRLRESQTGFRGRTLLILSGRDLTAREYEMRVSESPEWQRWLHSPGVTVHRFEEADHTFSCAAWRDTVAAWSRDWILDLARERA
jgi:exosortase A-associated hydrolase 1